MKIQIDTKNKTITLLEDISFSELKNFIKTLKDGDEYEIIRTIEYQQHYYPYYTYTNPILYTDGTSSNTFSITNNID